MRPAVELRRVHKEYRLGKLVVLALRGIDLVIERGEFAAIAGPSGSGKTTLLNLVGCVDVATRGTVIVDGEETGALGDSGLTRLRLRKLGFVFQSFNLIPVLNVMQNVEFPLLLQGVLGTRERHLRVLRIVERVGLSAQIRQRPNELSGGERQRVAIARALVAGPQIVLADEPTANLDLETGKTIVDLMRQMNREQGTTFLFSTHDPRIIEGADRVIRIEDGQVLAGAGRNAGTAATP